MFCQFCGKEIAEGEACGCAKEREALGKTIENAEPEIRKNNTAFVIAAVAAIAVVVAIIVLLIVSVSGGGCKKPVDKFVKAMNECDGELLVEASCTDKLLRYLDREEDMEYEDVCDRFEDMIDDTIDDWEDYYGDNVKLSVKYGDKYELDDEEIEEIEDEYRADGYRVKIEQAYEIECDFTIAGEDDKDDEKTDIIVIKVEDEGWKIYLGTLYDLLG